MTCLVSRFCLKHLLRPKHCALDANTEARILNAALVEFQERGYHGARMAQIASRADVNKASLHYYYRNKDSLYQKVLNHIFDIFWNNLELQKEMNAEELIVFIVERCFQTALESPECIGVMMNELATGALFFEKLDSDSITKMNGNSLAIMDNLQQAIDKGELQDIAPLHIFSNITGMCFHTFLSKPFAENCQHKYKLNINDSFFENRMESIVQMTLSGLLTKKDS